MKMPLVMTLGLLALIHQGGFSATEVNAAIPPAGEKPAFTYQNPISKGIDPKGLRERGTAHAGGRSDSLR